MFIHQKYFLPVLCLSNTSLSCAGCSDAIQENESKSLISFGRPTPRQKRPGWSTQKKNRPKVGGVATYPLSSLSWTKKNNNGVWTLTKYSFVSKVEQPLYSRSCYLFMEMIAQKRSFSFTCISDQKTESIEYWKWHRDQHGSSCWELFVRWGWSMIISHKWSFHTDDHLILMIISQLHVCLDHAADHEFCRELWKQDIWI